jgi:hypothetical protein
VDSLQFFVRQHMVWIGAVIKKLQSSMSHVHAVREESFYRYPKAGCMSYVKL